MGVNISKIIPKREIEISDLKGKTIAIDAYVTLYQFLTTIRQPNGTPLQDSNGNITSHLSGLFYRNINLLQEGIKPIYVFDGKPPALKLSEIKKRQEAKKVAEQQFQEAKAKDDIASMKKYSSRTVKITDTIIQESKDLLDALGIPVIQAPSEGESEAATLARQGKVYAAASQDYDALLYETPYLIRNLTSARRKKMPSGLYIDIKPEMITFQSVLDELKVNKDQLICLAILVGTDYNPGGIKGLGQKRALELVQKYKDPKEIFKAAQEFINKKNSKNGQVGRSPHQQPKTKDQQREAPSSLPFDWQEIFNQFHEYKSEYAEEIKFKEVNEAKVKQILSEHDFSETRIDSGLQKLKNLKEAKKQKGLSDFF
jgi:flap endonuclease-1